MDAADTWTPKPGLYRTRLKARGPWVPVRVWWQDGARDEAGELVGDQVLRCEVDGDDVDPWKGLRKTDDVGEFPRHLFFVPISAAEFQYLRAYRQHVLQWGEPADKAQRYKPRRTA